MRITLRTCIYIYIDIHVHMCVYVHLYVHIYLCMYTCGCICTHMYACVYINMCVYGYVYVYIYIYIPLYICRYMYVCTYTYMLYLWNPLISSFNPHHLIAATLGARLQRLAPGLMEQLPKPRPTQRAHVGSREPIGHGSYIRSVIIRGHNRSPT